MANLKEAGSRARRPRRSGGGIGVALILVTLAVAGAGVWYAVSRSERGDPRGPASGDATRGAKKDMSAEGGDGEAGSADAASLVPEPEGTPIQPPDPLDRTPVAELAGPYEDRLQQKIPFGRRSYYLSPWRAYMDTWPASRFLECLGVSLNGVTAEEAEPTLRVLAEAGIRAVRVEVGWSSFRYDEPSRLPDDRKRHLDAVFGACRRHGVRPIILLNGHHGAPCPIEWFDVDLTKDAPAGALEVFVDNVDRIRPQYTGLTNVEDYIAAKPMITEVDAATGRCALSEPLPKDLKAGKLRLSLLRYQPFSGEEFADGTPNPAARQTAEGWLTYVRGISAAAKSALGTEGALDAGFDLEVWNEYTFGSSFLDIKHYYKPALEFRKPLTYEKHGRKSTGCEAILPMTVDWVNDPANGCPGVGVVSGFSNQSPWASGTSMWPGQMGFSRHYYTGIEIEPLSPANERNTRSGPLDALGAPDGTPDGKDWHTVIEGTFFIPTLNISMPEMWHYGYKTEFMTRDVQPFPGPWRDHHRYSHPGTGRPAEVWMTEFNTWRAPWAGQLRKAAGCEENDPRLVRMMHHLGAKVALRTFAFQSHKGVHTITMFSVKEPDTQFGVIPSAYYAKLKEAGYELTDDVRAAVGPQIGSLARAAKLMRTGEPLPVTRRLEVAKLVEREPRVVFKGDGTPGHPDRFHRDDFAVLPFQLAADRFAVGYYVVTRGIVKDWRPELDLLDPARYDMPPQEFDLTLANVRGRGATVSAYDPFTDKTIPVRKLGGDGTTLSVRVVAVDYPRFLMIEESRPGPLVLRPMLAKHGKGASLTFATNVEAPATVTWGPHPYRKGGSKGGITGQYFSGMNFETPKLTRQDPIIAFDWAAAPAEGLPADAFSVRWTGKLVPAFSETYTFHAVSDDGVRLWVDGKKLVENWTNHGATEDTDTAPLEKGRAYDVIMEYYESSGGATARLLWSSDSQEKEPVPFSSFTIGGGADDGPRDGVAELPPAREHSVDIEELGATGAVRVTIEEDGLKCRWPQWDWDVAGVLGFAGAGQAERGADALELPKLLPGKRPAAWELTDTKGWTGAGGDRSRKAGDLTARLRFVEGGLDGVRALLPTTSVQDSVVASAVDWSGAPAWRIDVALDATAHPGERDLRRRFLVAPVGEGHLVLSLAGTAEAFARSAGDMARAAEGVRFR